MFSAKQVGERVKQRRKEQKMTMQDLGERLGVNKSTIQRYETVGVDPTRTMIIKGLAEALFTTPEWLTGQTDDAEYNSYSLSRLYLDGFTDKYFHALLSTVTDKTHQETLTTVLGQFINLYTVFTRYFARTMEKIDQLSEDEGLKESIMKYSIDIHGLEDQVFRKEMAVPIAYMKQYMDSLLNIYDWEESDDSMQELFAVIDRAERKLTEKRE